jgi:hypothetical protein
VGRILIIFRSWVQIPSAVRYPYNSKINYKGMIEYKYDYISYLFKKFLTKEILKVNNLSELAETLGWLP